MYVGESEFNTQEWKILPEQWPLLEGTELEELEGAIDLPIERIDEDE